VHYDVAANGCTISLDVDLPEIEDLPSEQATVAARGLRVIVKPRSDTQRRIEYMRHVHGVLFRLVGEVFALFPHVARVLISGYSQRLDAATGVTRDDYLLSAIVDRPLWEGIDLTNLAAVDVVAAFERFELRRKMTKTGVFRSIAPFEVA
jgi:hypothetical protein